MIELERLSAGYRGVPVLENVELSFPAGKLTVLLGPNGCGKSTLLKTAVGLVPPIRGRVLYDGTPLTDLNPTAVARRAAYMAQNRPVPNIAAGRLVLHGRFAYLRFPRQYRRQDLQAVRAALARADAAALADRPLPELSGGQRQKVYFAMALAQDTPTVLMDEPTAFLDIGHQLELLRTARALAAEGRAVVLVLHDLCLALRSADVLAVLAEGALQQVGTPEEIYAGGVLRRVFGVRVQRLETPDGPQFYCV